MKIRAILKPVLALLLLHGAVAQAGQNPVYTSFFSNAAAGGYDVTAYFSQGKPVKGIDEFKAEHNGADWYFSNADNLALFLKNPEMYAPQYGGYCAWAVAQGDTASGDPEQWDIHDGKLYLNYDREIRDRWQKDKLNFIAQGDRNWPTVLE